MLFRKCTRETSHFLRQVSNRLIDDIIHIKQLFGKLIIIQVKQLRGKDIYFSRGVQHCIYVLPLRFIGDLLLQELAHTRYCGKGVSHFVSHHERHVTQGYNVVQILQAAQQGIPLVFVGFFFDILDQAVQNTVDLNHLASFFSHLLHLNVLLGFLYKLINGLGHSPHNYKSA